MEPGVEPTMTVESDDALLRRPPSAYFDRLTTSTSTLEGGHLTAPTTPTDITPPSLNKSGKRQKWTAVLKDLPKSTWSRAGTPTASTPGSPITDTDEWFSSKDWEKLQEKKERKRRRKKAEIYVCLSWYAVSTRTYTDDPCRSPAMLRRSYSARSSYASLHVR